MLILMQKNVFHFYFILWSDESWLYPCLVLWPSASLYHNVTIWVALAITHSTHTHPHRNIALCKQTVSLKKMVIIDIKLESKVIPLTCGAPSRLQLCEVAVQKERLLPACPTQHVWTAAEAAVQKIAFADNFESTRLQPHLSWLMG